MLIRLTGKTETELGNEDCAIESTAYNSVIRTSIEQSGDDYLGLHSAESLNIAAAGLIGQITQTSETIKQALLYCCEFANLGCSSLPMQLSFTKGEYKLRIRPNALWLNEAPDVVQQTADGVLAFTLKEFRSSTLHKHQAKRIHVSWPEPENSFEYQRVFACPVYFSQNEIAIFLDEDLVNEKIITANYSLLRILVGHAEEISQAKSGNSFSSLAKQAIVRLLKPNFPTINEVASHLNYSVRTFQRKLKAENTAYKELVDEVKKEFAMSYLKKNELTISETADLLGYNDLSAFSRSFKRWMQVSPKQYRAQNI